MKKLYIETYGCQMNVADSEVVASVMQMAGYEPTESLDEADAVFLNTCSVRDNAEQKIYRRLDALNAERKRRSSLPTGEGRGRGSLIIGVLGCMAERVKDDLLANHHADLVAGPDAYLSLPDLIAQAETGHKAINIELSTSETYRDIVPQRLHGAKIGGFVSIMRGCNNFCHYCIVPYTPVGKRVSYGGNTPLYEAVSEIVKLLLTDENGAYCGRETAYININANNPVCVSALRRAIPRI